MTKARYDLVVVGSGILGLAHALQGVRRGLRTLVLERDARPVGASIRNFGFVTVTGQRRGDTWRRAHRTARIWAAIAAPAGIEIIHRGLLVLARRTEAAAVLDAFMATEMGEGCTRLSAAAARDKAGRVEPEALVGGLWSPHEIRVESRLAIPALVRWLDARGVEFRFSTPALAIEDGRVETPAGAVEAGAIVVCPGDDLSTLYGEAVRAAGVQRCVLQMLRLEPPGFSLPGAVMTDLSLARYRGYADLAESAPLRARLEAEQGAHLAHGIHLIAVQSADGSLVVGDSHHYAPTPDPFAAAEVEQLILDECRATLGSAPPVRERWVGTYSSGPDDLLRIAPSPGVRLVMVTTGAGASTAFAIAEETAADLFGASERSYA